VQLRDELRFVSAFLHGRQRTCIATPTADASATTRVADPMHRLDEAAGGVVEK
jgi:hypothetical protein